MNVFVIIDDGTVFRAIGFIGLEEEEAVAAAILLSYTEHILLGVLPSAATRFYLGIAAACKPWAVFAHLLLFLSPCSCLSDLQPP